MPIDEPLALAVAAALLARQADPHPSHGGDPMSPEAVASEVASALMSGVHGVEAAFSARQSDPEAFLMLARAIAFAPLHDDVEAMRDLLASNGWTEPGIHQVDFYAKAADSGLLSEIFQDGTST